MRGGPIGRREQSIRETGCGGERGYGLLKRRLLFGSRFLELHSLLHAASIEITAFGRFLPFSPPLQSLGIKKRAPNWSPFFHIFVGTGGIEPPTPTVSR